MVRGVRCGVVKGVMVWDGERSDGEVVRSDGVGVERSEGMG